MRVVPAWLGGVGFPSACALLAVAAFEETPLRVLPLEGVLELLATLVGCPERVAALLARDHLRMCDIQSNLVT